MATNNNQKWHQTQSSSDTIDIPKAFWECHRADIASGNSGLTG